MTTQGEAALIEVQNKIAKQAEISNMLQMMQMKEFNEFSQDLKARVVKLTKVRLDGYTGW